jgi:hypothetical protein
VGGRASGAGIGHLGAGGGGGGVRAGAGGPAAAAGEVPSTAAGRPTATRAVHHLLEPLPLQPVAARVRHHLRYVPSRERAREFEPRAECCPEKGSGLKTRSGVLPARGESVSSCMRCARVITSQATAAIVADSRSRAWAPPGSEPPTPTPPHSRTEPTVAATSRDCSLSPGGAGGTWVQSTGSSSWTR